MKTLNIKLLLKHITGWAIFIAYEISFIRFSGAASSPLPAYACYYGLNITLFYVNAHVMLPFAIRSRRPYSLIPFFMLLELALYLVLKYLLDHVLAFGGHAIPGWFPYFTRLLVPNAYRGIYFLGFSTLYWSVLRVTAFRKRVFETEKMRLTIIKEKAELERNLAEAQNAYLQQQINPHLLFNTLTFIHNTYYKFSREAAQCVLLLSDIMRFSLDEVGADHQTLLLKEIEQIRNFIELNQLRFDYQLYIDLQVEGEIKEQQIIPLILLTLTENIFKHGNLKSKAAAARLHIAVNEQNELSFVSWNLKKHQSSNQRLRSIGLKNVIKRLNYSYKQNYFLNIKDEEDSYYLELRLPL